MGTVIGTGGSAITLMQCRSANTACFAAYDIDHSLPSMSRLYCQTRRQYAWTERDGNPHRLVILIGTECCL